jgi:hypothetical protein
VHRGSAGWSRSFGKKASRKRESTKLRSKGSKRNDFAFSPIRSFAIT